MGDVTHVSRVCRKTLPQSPVQENEGVARRLFCFSGADCDPDIDIDSVDNIYRLGFSTVGLMCVSLINS